MCGLGIEMCVVGPILACTYSTLLGTMGHIQIITAFLYIIWQIRVLPGTHNILKRVFMGTFATQSVVLHLILVLAKRQKFEKIQKFGYLRR